MKFLFLLIPFCLCFQSLNAQAPDADPFMASAARTADGDNYNHLPKFDKFVQNFDPAAHQISPIEPFDLKSLMETRNRIFIIDTREAEEFEVSHIQGAKQISYEGFTIEKVWMFDKNTTIILYSTDGERCAHVAAYMKSMGYVDVRVISGSIIGWVNAGYPLVDKEGKVTKSVMVKDKSEAKEPKKGTAYFGQ